MSRYHNIYVVYTKQAETADAYIEKATYELGRHHRVRVATSDGTEQLIILGHGALRLSARAFRAEVEQAGQPDGGHSGAEQPAGAIRGRPGRPGTGGGRKRRQNERKPVESCKVGRSDPYTPQSLPRRRRRKSRFYLLDKNFTTWYF